MEGGGRGGGGGAGGIILQENNFLSRDGLLAGFYQGKNHFRKDNFTLNFPQREPLLFKETWTVYRMLIASQDSKHFDVLKGRFRAIILIKIENKGLF